MTSKTPSRTLMIFIVTAALAISLGHLPAFANRPLIGIFGITSGSQRCQVMTVILAKGLDEAVVHSGVFDKVNSGQLTEQLQKFQCTDETCFVPFARRADIGVVITGEIADMDRSVRLTLKAFGTDAPSYGKMICRYTADIPIQKGYSAAVLGSIFREHSFRFMSLLLGSYRAPFTVQTLKSGGSCQATGTFPVYRQGASKLGDLAGLEEIGTARLKNGILVKTDPGAPDTHFADNDIVIVHYRERSREMDEYMYNLKREMVLERWNYESLAYAILLTAPSSAFMPVLAPTLGYMLNGDWQGLALWTINAPFYIYLEIDGLTNIPSQYRRDRRDISREVHARFRFALYMVCAGGLSLVMDATANPGLRRASMYEGEPPLLSGDNLVAAYFSLVSGGGGHFFRGYRLWGYFYFHLNNLLLYYMLREFSYSERYDAATDSYHRGEINEERAYTLAGAFALVKVIEVIHVLLLRDRIWNGRVREETFALEPVLLPTDTGTALGLRFSFRY